MDQDLNPDSDDESLEEDFLEHDEPPEPSLEADAGESPPEPEKEFDSDTASSVVGNHPSDLVNAFKDILSGARTDNDLTDELLNKGLVSDSNDLRTQWDELRAKFESVPETQGVIPPVEMPTVSARDFRSNMPMLRGKNPPPDEGEARAPVPAISFNSDSDVQLEAAGESVGDEPEATSSPDAPAAVVNDESISPASNSSTEETQAVAEPGVRQIDVPWTAFEPREDSSADRITAEEQGSAQDASPQLEENLRKDVTEKQPAVNSPKTREPAAAPAPLVTVALATKSVEQAINELVSAAMARQTRQLEELVDAKINEALWQWDCQMRAILGS